MNNTGITRIESNGVNCYLVKTETGFVLIDTGYAKDRGVIDAALAEAGCENIRLIVLTHGDFDHAGNAAHLRQLFGCRIIMHGSDLGMVERGDIFWNRDMGSVMRAFGRLFLFFKRMGIDKADRFSPDLLVEGGESLREFGVEATVHHLPGHSKGSIGLLTAEGHFFCGDLFTNVSSPKKSTLISNREDYTKSLETIQQLDIRTVYPGHGTPFSQEALSDIFQEEN
jgi:hydroxyacylglutathione hydrolase